MKKSHTCPYLEILFSKFYLTIALLLTSFFAEPLKADQNNTSFIVAGGNLNSPFYTLTFEANGSAVDFEIYPLRKGNTYAFKPGSISASHPFNIGASHNVSSPHVTGGPLDQNSANNGQSMTVSIPNDFQGTLAYFCTVHASMNRTFIILEPNPVDTNGTNFLPVYDLNSTHLHSLTSAQGVVVEGNYSIVEEMNATNNPEIRIRPMFFSNGDWQIAGQNQFYNANQNIQSMQDVDAYLQSQNLYPVNGPQGHPIYDLNTTQVTYLTNGAVNQAGHYAVVDVNQSHADLEPVQQDGNGSWIVTPADDYVNLVPSRFSDINATKAWLDANASAPVAYLPFDNNQSQPGDHNQSNPGSGSDQNSSTNIAVFDLNSSHLYQLTGSESAPEGNYSIVEEDDGQGGTYLTALPMQFSNGQWQEDPQGIPYPLNSQAFPVMQDVDAFLQSQNLYPVNGPQGHPVYDLNTTQVTNLTNGAVNQAGHYAVVDVNQSHADLEPVQQDGNGSWIVTPADDYVNLVPSRFSDINAIKAWFDANASAPVAYLPFDNNHSQPGDHNQTNPGSGPNDHNTSGHLAVFDLNSSHLYQLTGSESASEGNYSIVEQDDGQGGTYLTALPMQFSNGQWQEDPQGIPYPLNSQAFPVMQDVDTFLQSQNLYPINGPQGHPIYDLNTTQVTNLTNGAANQAGHYAVVDVNQSHADLEPVQQDGNGSWIITPADDYVNLVPSHFSDINATKVWFDANASAPVAYLPFDNNHSQPGDHNQTNPGSGPNDHNTSGHLAVFDLNSSHLYQLTGSESAPEGNYSIVEEDDGQGGTYLTALPMQFSNGQWQEDPQGIPYPLNSQAFPVMQDVDTFLQSQNLYPINGPQGHPIYDLNTTQVTNLTNGAANQAGHYAVVDVNQSHADLEPVQQDGNGSWIITPADDYVNLVPSHFSDINATKVWFDANASAPVAYLPFDNNHSQPGDHNQSNPGSAGDHNDTQGLPVFALDVTQVETLVDGFASAGSYAVEIFMDYDTGIEQRLLVSAVQLTGIWEREFDALGNPIALPISSAQFPTPDSIYQYIDQQNLQPIGYIFENHDHNGTDPGGDPWDQNGTNQGSGGDHNDTQGLPVFALDVTQAETLVDGFASAGSYAVEIFMDYDTGIEQLLLVSAVQLAGIWEREFDALGNPIALPISSAQFPTPDSIYQYIDQQNLQPIGYIFENHDHNGTDPGGDPWDQNGTNQGSGGDQNDTQGLPVFALDVTQAETLVDGFASAGSYAVEIFMDYETGIEQRLLVSAVQLAGVWEREFDALGNPIALPISSAHFPNTDYIYQYIDQQNLEPIGFLMEDPDDHEDDGPFDFTIIGEVDLTNPQNLFELATDHDSIWFQKWSTPENLENIYWALSIESNNSDISSLVVDMNGSIYSGNFHSYWRDAFGIIAEYENEESDWKEYRYDRSEISIQKLYYEVPELYGQDRPLPPILKTSGKPIFRNNFIQVSAYIESLGNNPDLIFGFQVSDSIFFDQAEEIIVQGNFAEGDLLETSFDFSYLEADRLYYRAFARNSLFESFGTKKRARMPVIETIPPTLFPDAERLEDGWKENWLGVFHEYSNGWMYHLDLGWCFASPDNLGNVWLWINDHGWVWTNDSTWPHLFRNQTSSWLYLLIRQSGPAVFFDQMHGSFMHLNK